jgi:hypothetical protein
MFSKHLIISLVPHTVFFASYCVNAHYMFGITASVGEKLPCSYRLQCLLMLHLSGLLSSHSHALPQFSSCIMLMWYFPALISLTPDGKLKSEHNKTL